MKFKRLFALLLLGMCLIVANAAEAVVGDKGPQGPTGKKGPTGDKGPRGDQGATGATGRTGAAGPKGGKGDQGLPGNTGATGRTGAAGPKGGKGDQGLPGDKGLQGDKGDAGTNGTNGGKGLPGDKGPQGPIGLTGDTGPAGTFPDGNVAGDMQYWDGYNWVMIPAPNLPLMATLHFCNGAPTWSSTCIPVNTTVYNIGNTGPGGGKVFYLNDNTGLHGLEAAPADQSSDATWGCEGTSILGANVYAVGFGAASTAAIVAGCSDVNIAARLADDYVHNGYSDWFLPDIRELHLLVQQKDLVGGFASNYYWSSTEASDYHAEVENFGAAGGGSFIKSYNLPVRAIRYF